MSDLPELAQGPRPPDLSIVVPVYRSENCLEPLAEAIERALRQGGWEYELVLVNDSSPDGSWAVIEGLCRRHPNVVGVNLRRNFGQDNAVLTGLRFARGRYIAIMDDDLQHDPRDLPTLVAKAEEGADVVYAQFRVKRQKLWKNVGSWFNGKMAEWLFDKPRTVYMSPYKVIRREVAELICRYEGPYPYVDGLLFQVTSRVTQIPATHHPRFSGESNYTLARSMAVWIRVATSFSVRPLRLVSLCGVGSAVLGGLFATWVVLNRLLFPENFPPEAVGWASLMVALMFIGGAQMVFLGVLGEYTGRSYMTLCGRPQATICDVLGAEKRGEAPGRDAREAGRGP
jgi:undecaprenyl-phosphate 4-deoxy-4-formamido-L-arabinose transferase